MSGLFEYNISNQADNTITASIKIDAGHEIFPGHFPGYPLVPGVCQLQIIKDIANKGLNMKLRLWKAKSIKFLNMLNPDEKNEINAEISYNIEKENTVKINARIYSEKETYLKLIAEFREDK